MNTLITGNTKFYSQTQNREFIELLRRNPPFTPEEEVEAFKRLYAGDEKALDEIVAKNQRWVYSLAKEFARDEIEVMDYVQEGNIGLLKAIEKYDLSKGLKFITYAVWYMRRQMNEHMNNRRDLVTKSNNAKYSKKLERIKNEFFVQHGYKASFDDIKEIFEEKYGIVINDDRDLYDLSINSINEYVNDDTTVETCDDFIKATAIENAQTAQDEVDYYRELVLPVLYRIKNKNDRDIIKKIYHIGFTDEERKKYEKYTIEDICNEYKRSEEEIKKLESNILLYMRQQISIIKLKSGVMQHLLKTMKTKKMSEIQKKKVNDKFSKFFDSCFDENSKDYNPKETIQETVNRVIGKIDKYMSKIKNIKVAV